MKSCGRIRLENFRESISELNVQEAYDAWLENLFTNLVADQSSRALLITSQQLHLQTIWLSIIEYLTTIICYNNMDELATDGENPIFKFFHSIIRIVQIPKIFSIFLASIHEDIDIAYHALHQSIRLKIRLLIISEIDRLLIGTVSAGDYFERNESPGLYDALEDIISKVNIKFKQRNIAKSLHANIINQIENSTPTTEILDFAYQNLCEIIDLEAPFTSSSLGRTLSLNLELGANVTSLARSQGIELPIQLYAPEVREEDEIDGKYQRHFGLITQIEPPRISAQLQAQMTTGRSLQAYENSKCIHITLKLNSYIIHLLRTYTAELTEKMNEWPRSDYYARWKQKYSFSNEILTLDQTKKLSPHTFFQATQNKPLLFSGSWRNRAYLYYSFIHYYLIHVLFHELCKYEGTDSPFMYKITDPKLLKDLQDKKDSFDALPDNFNYENIKSYADNNVFRWRAEKFGALNHILKKHMTGTIQPSDIPYIRHNFICYDKSSSPLWFPSKVKKYVDEVEGHIKQMAWIDMGGDGPAPQAILRNKLQNH